MATTLQDILKKKKNNKTLTEEEICKFGKMVSSNEAHDAQIGAMLMAVSINGMTSEETYHLTKAMVNSGNTLKWPYDLVADKHSTGGVGDKVSIPLAPILAELGLKVPMISGRSLEHTGGTLDKLESIPGFKVDLSPEEMLACIEKCGCFIAAATKDICPADRKTYAIRDVTSTVDCTPLITASILSKKIAEGTKFLIQDIKVGKAAFYKDIESAKDLGKTMIATAKYFGVKMAAILTKMDHPLGRAVGNSVEVKESIEILRGTQYPQDLMELILELGGELLVMTGIVSSLQKAKDKIKDVIANGTALKKFKNMLVCQGVSEENANELCFGNMEVVLPKASKFQEFKTSSKGYVENIDAMIIAKICFKIGGGRKIPSEKIDPTVGCEILVAQGQQIQEGTTWAILHHNKTLTPKIIEEMNSAIKLAVEPVPQESMIIETIY